MILPFLLVTLVLMLEISGSSPAASGDVLKLINAFKGMPRADQATFLQQIQPLPTQSPALPQWYLTLRAQPGAVVVDDSVREYTDEAWRLSPESGFGGTDLMHSASRSPVRILQYTLLKAPAPRAAEQSNGADADADADTDPLPYPRLVGAAYFSEAAEGHQHLCHGGSMCALCDDALGWIGFCADGSVRPWAGYTVQVDTTLKKSVPTGSLLKVEAWVERREGPRKIWASCRLTDADGTVYCTGKGLVLLKPEFVAGEGDNHIPATNPEL